MIHPTIAVMVWLNPSVELTFEILVGVLKRAGFVVAVDQIGRAFDLKGLLIHSICAPFLSND
jgi:hypothetical protein